MKKKEQLEETRNIIVYLLNDSLEEVSIQELLERIDIKIEEGDDGMSSLYERLVNENIHMIREGKRKARIEIAKKLIKKKQNDESILEITEISQKDLDKLKQKILVEK